MDFIAMRPNNMQVEMTRRYPNLKKKQLKRDAKIAKRLVDLWDTNGDEIGVMDYFIDNCDKLSPERYWELLRSVWILCGSVERAAIFRQLFTAKARSQYYFSTPEEHEKLRELPDDLTLYRACNDKNDGGLSWTLSLEYAKEYQQRFSKIYIVTKQFYKMQVFALVDRNLEYELIIL